MIKEIRDRTFVRVTTKDDGTEVPDGAVVMKELLDLEEKVLKTVYLGKGGFVYQRQQIPLEFPIEAATIEEAFEKYHDEHKAIVKKCIDEIQRPKIATPNGSLPQPPNPKGNIITGDFK